MVYSFNFSSMKEMEEKIGYVTTQLAPLFTEIKENPYDPCVWEKVVQIAQKEEPDRELLAITKGFHATPLAEMVDVGEKIRVARSLEEKYRILAKKCSTGELWYDIILRGNQKILKILKREIGRKKWTQALDVGCGTGNSIRAISEHCENIYGLDIFPFLLEITKVHPEFPKNAKLVVGNAVKLPFGNQEFDLVYCNGLTGYLTEKELLKFYNEAVRVLKLGGSYFEILGDKDGDVPTSGKALLAYLIGEMVTGKAKEKELFPIFEATFLKEKFKYLPRKVERTSPEEIAQQLGVSVFDISPTRIAKNWVLEFRKVAE